MKERVRGQEERGEKGREDEKGDGDAGRGEEEGRDRRG